MAKKMRNGKAYEHTVVGILTLAGFDVYTPVVDDQGIDGILRVPTDAGVRYFDYQVKGSRDWKVRCWTERLPVGSVLIVYCDKTRELLWFTQTECVELFPVTGQEWGDMFLSAPMIQRFREEGRGDLARLRQRLQAPV